MPADKVVVRRPLYNCFHLAVRSGPVPHRPSRGPECRRQWI